MLVLVAAVVGGLVGGLLLGGSMANLERLALRLPWLVVIALGLQIVAFSPLVSPLPHGSPVVMHVASYGFLLVFVAANLPRPPVMLFGLGVLLNAVTIVANRGYMPARAAAMRTAGLPVSVHPHNNSVLDGAHTHLWFLGDVVGVPHWLPLANVFSLGDVLIAIGLAWLVAVTMKGPAPLADAPPVTE
jgi:Family of unknown function (DUF5317)